MTIATLSYPPCIRPAGIGFARAIMRTGAIAGLIFFLAYPLGHFQD